MATGLTLEELQQRGATVATPIGERPVAPSGFPVKERPSFLQNFVSSEPGTDVVETVAGIGREFGKAGEDIFETITEGKSGDGRDLNIFEKGIQALSQGFRGGARAFGEGVLGAGKLLFSEDAEQRIGRGVEKVAGKVAESSTVQDVVARYQSLDPEAKRNIDNALGFGEGLAEILTAGGASKVTRPLLEVVEQVIKRTGKTVSEINIPSFRSFQSALRPQTRTKAIDYLEGALKDSFVENRTAINRKLDSIAGKSGSSREEVMRQFAEEGYVPEVEGRLANFNQTFNDLATRKASLMESLDPILNLVPERTPLEQLRTQTKLALRQSGQIVENLDSSLSEVDRFFNSFATKYGDDLNAVELNQIRKAMNSRTRAFGEEAFKQDTADAIADAMRARLDELVPTGEVRTANAEWARLNNLEKVARTLHNQQIDVGILGRALGSYAGTIAASGLGLSVGGPGGLIVAGLAAHYGGDAFANFLRRARFSPEIQKLIQTEITADQKVVQQLLETASKENKAFLERQLLPAPGQTSVIELPPAELGIPRQ